MADAPLKAVGASVVAVEGQPFQGRVATFLDASPFDSASSYMATIDWGDGVTSAGTVAADGSFSGQFAVAGDHTYQEAGAYPIRVTIHDDGGSTATATGTIDATASAGQITYHAFLDTQGETSAPAILRFQFNPGSLPGAQAATATITFDAAAGEALDPVVLVDATQLNQASMSISGISALSFDVTLSGDAVSLPSGGRFDTTLAVQLMAGDGATPLLTSDPSGAVFVIDLDPDGTATARSLDVEANAARPAVLARNVDDAPLSPTGTSLDAGAPARASPGSSPGSPIPIPAARRTTSRRRSTGATGHPRPAPSPRTRAESRDSASSAPTPIRASAPSTRRSSSSTRGERRPPL